jgi:hypothetical protein
MEDKKYPELSEELKKKLDSLSEGLLASLNETPSEEQF